MTMEISCFSCDFLSFRRRGPRPRLLERTPHSAGPRGSPRRRWRWRAAASAPKFGCLQKYIIWMKMYNIRIYFISMYVYVYIYIYIHIMDINVYKISILYLLCSCILCTDFNSFKNVSCRPRLWVAHCRATSRPIPVEAPVTKAT